MKECGGGRESRRITCDCEADVSLATTKRWTDKLGNLWVGWIVVEGMA
jgi:hypothetical protein